MEKLSKEEVIRALEEPGSEQDPNYIVETGDSDSSSDESVEEKQNHNVLNNSGNLSSTSNGTENYSNANVVWSDVNPGFQPR
jgi:hypothetical protein